MPVRFVGELPPTKHRIRLAVRRVADQLKERPGEWAEIKRYSGKKKQAAYVYAHNCKMGKNRTLSPEMGFRVKAQADGFGSVVVYGRYVGLNNEYAAEPEVGLP